MNKITEVTWDNLTTARFHLLKEFRFFGEIASYLRPEESELIPTAAITDKGIFLLNPNFANKATASDFVFILCHEAMHIVSATLKRRPSHANIEVWNWAGDYAINYMILDAGIKAPRKELIEPLYDTKFANQSHEEIYEELMKNKEESGKKAKNKWCDNVCCDCENAMEEGNSDLEKAKWEQRIIQAANSAREAGQLPGWVENFVANLTKPKYDWKRLLCLTMQSCIKKSFTWKRPNRRTIAINVITPGKLPELPEAIVYIDTSGSISDNDMNEALSEVMGILSVTCGKGTLILGDAEVYYFGEMTKNSIKKLPVQRGGTDFVCVFERIKKEKLKPKVFVGFSDLCGPFPSEAPNYPCIWVRPTGYQHGKAPFGRVIDAEFKKT